MQTNEKRPIAGAVGDALITLSLSTVIVFLIAVSVFGILVRECKQLHVRIMFNFTQIIGSIERVRTESSDRIFGISRMKKTTTSSLSLSQGPYFLHAPVLDW
jgi:hypothetical protein